MKILTEWTLKTFKNPSKHFDMDFVWSREIGSLEIMVYVCEIQKARGAGGNAPGEPGDGAALATKVLHHLFQWQLLQQKLQRISIEFMNILEYQDEAGCSKMSIIVTLQSQIETRKVLF